jgi:pyruvate dehydrogenase E2 component (dihydrolipoamide acetyltransferase)
MADVIMPRLSDSMEEGTILRWLKQDGDEVKRGDELLEIETDKATMTYESDASGTLRITEQEGAVVAVGAVIGHLGDPAGASRAPAPSASASAERSASVASGAANADGTATIAPVRADDGLKASPMARRAAQRLGVELSTVTGSGPSGRILKADVIAAADSAAFARPAVS